MERKKIIVIEKAENQILGQESVFGWEMAQKEPSNKFLFLKYFKYTLVRERNEDEVTTVQVDVENKWNTAFDDYSNFMQTTYKKLIMALLIGILLLVVGYGLMMASFSSDDEGILYIGLIMDIVSIVVNLVVVIMMMKPIKKLKNMDKISREMRQANAIKNMTNDTK